MDNVVCVCVCVCVCVLLRHHVRSFYCTVLNELQDSELQYSVNTSPSSLGHMQQAVIAPLLGLMYGHMEGPQQVISHDVKITHGSLHMRC